MAKQTRKAARRRKASGTTVVSEDALQRPFGAMIHMDHIVMKHGSRSAKTAKCALTVKDEKTEFGAVFPANSRDAQVIVSNLRILEGALGPQDQ